LKDVALFEEGMVTFLKEVQEEKALAYEAQEFSEGGSVTVLRLKQLEKVVPNPSIPVEFEGNVISKRLEQLLNALPTETKLAADVGIITFVSSWHE
jgi:hypothetical protein